VAFEGEQQTYERNKDRLLAEGEGQYAVILGNDVMGPYSTYADAFNQGVNAFGGGSKFLIKRILRNEPVSFVPPVAVVRTSEKPWEYSTQHR
jgi:hypothetical protein